MPKKPPQRQSQPLPKSNNLSLDRKIALWALAVAVVAAIAGVIQSIVVWRLMDDPSRQAIRSRQIDHFIKVVDEIGRIQDDFNECSENKLPQISDCEKSFSGKWKDYGRRIMPMATMTYVLSPYDASNYESDVYEKFFDMRRDFSCANLVSLERAINAYVEGLREYLDTRSFSRSLPGSVMAGNFKTTFGFKPCGKSNG